MILYVILHGNKEYSKKITFVVLLLVKEIQICWVSSLKQLGWSSWSTLWNHKWYYIIKQYSCWFSQRIWSRKQYKATICKNFCRKDITFSTIFDKIMIMNLSLVLKKLKFYKLHSKIDKDKAFYVLLTNANITLFRPMKGFILIQRLKFIVHDMMLYRKQQFEHINLRKQVCVVAVVKLNQTKVHGNM